MREIIKSVVIKHNMGKYDDIINLPHHVSKNHPQMSNYNRAAQFAPFAALVGYSEAIKNSEIKYENRIELSDERKDEISATLNSLKKDDDIEVKYFVIKSKNTNQGKYITYAGKVHKIDYIEGKIIFNNRKSIYIKDIYEIKEAK